MEKRIKFRVKYLCCIFAALIFSMNGVRYLLNIQESNSVIYGIYVLFIAGSLISYQSNIKWINHLGFIPDIAIAFAAFGIITLLFGNMTDTISGVKIILIFLIAFSFYLMDSEDIRRTVNFTYFIITVFIVDLLLLPERIAAYLSKGSNYLVLTLPIGLLLSMQLARIIYQLYYTKITKAKLGSLALEIVVSVAAFISLTKFTGRGSMIFPFIVAIIFALVLGKGHFLKKVAVIAAIAAAAFIGILFFVKYANPYIVDRMLRLLTDLASEDRWKIWESYINYIFSNGYWFIGAGTGASVRDLGFYPHNIFLQCIGEFGIIGLALSGIITYSVVSVQIKAIRKPLISHSTGLLFTELSAGVMYLFLNFMKSFQIYETGVLLMMTFGVISIYYQARSEELQ